MKSSELLELLANAGITDTLDHLAAENTTAFPRSALEDIFADHGANSSADAVENCMQANLIEPFGSRFGISNFGRRTLLLVEALEGGDIADIYRRLRRMSG